jgi:hypothetical protein
MKAEMKMLDNGNYEAVPLAIQHECKLSEIMKCIQYSWDMKTLHLILEDGDPYEDGYSYKIPVNFCPVCGYKI